MKKFLKVTLIIALCLVGSMLLDQGLRWILPKSTWETCYEACEALKKCNAHILQKAYGEVKAVSEVPFSERMPERILSANEDKKNHTVEFLVFHSAEGTCTNSCSTTRYFFEFDEAGRLKRMTNTRCYYAGPSTESEIHNIYEYIYEVHCYDRLHCTDA